MGLAQAPIWPSFDYINFIVADLYIHPNYNAKVKNIAINIFAMLWTVLLASPFILVASMRMIN